MNQLFLRYKKKQKRTAERGKERESMLSKVNEWLVAIDNFVWGVPLIVMILAVGIYLTIRLRGIQITKLPRALKYMFQNEADGEGSKITSLGHLIPGLTPHTRSMASHTATADQAVRVGTWASGQSGFSSTDR